MIPLNATAEALQNALYARASSCTLSPSASAFSAILSAFIGSIINGLSSGWLVAFMTGWIAWLAIFRVLLGGIYIFYRSVTNSWGPGPGNKDSLNIPLTTAYAPIQSSTYLTADEHAYSSNSNSHGDPPPYSSSTYPPPKPPRASFKTMLWPPASVVRGNDATPQQPVWGKSKITAPPISLDRSTSALGWFSWSYTALFAPITQTLFIIANSSRHDIGATKIVKGLTVAVTALPLCIDCRVRYSDSLKWGRPIFNIITGTSCLLQGVFCGVLLIQGAVDVVNNSWGAPVPIFAIYPLFALIWMVASFAVLPMRDGGRRRAGEKHWTGYFLDLGAGAFAGVFLAAPALGLYMNAEFDRRVGGQAGDGMSDLGAYLACEGRWWMRWAAVSP
ncbi:hypothetical protein OQA88_11866 [Cercophora sp. LCS_1]